MGNPRQSFLTNIWFSSFCTQTTFPVTPSLATSPTMAFSPYLSHVSPGMGLVPAELLPNTPVLVSGNPTVTVPGGSAGQKLMRTDKLEVFGYLIQYC